MNGTRAPYGRRNETESGPRAGNGRQAGGGDSVRPYRGETYYDQPVIKGGPWGWLIATYFFIGGIAGASQLIATVAQLTGGERDRVVVRAGRYLALAGALASPVLLIADLRTPRRWYNMLRIYRGTSAMSIGSWTLSVFGALAGLLAAAQAADDLVHVALARPITRALALPGALAGAMLSVYTGVLLGATAVPLWSAPARLLPALFGASAASTASAALTLAAEASGAADDTVRRLDRLALAAGAAELALAVATEREWRRWGVIGPLRRQPASVAYRAGVLGLGVIGPLAVHAAQTISGRRMRTVAVAVAISTLVGGYILRAVVVLAGRASAGRPQDYYRLTQPDAQPAEENVPADRQATDGAPVPAATIPIATADGARRDSAAGGQES